MRAFFALLLSLSPPALASNIIYIGDSQSASDGTLLTQLAPALASRGHKLIAGDATCGAKISDHLDGGSAHCSYGGIKHLVVTGGRAEIQPGGGHVTPLATLMAGAGSADTVVVELGDNHYGDPQLAASARKMVTKILESGRKCVWIGPASISAAYPACASTVPKKKAVADVLAKTLASTVVNGRKCEFVNSFALTEKAPPHTGDRLCIHYYPTHYPEWATAIQPALLRALAGGGGGGGGFGSANAAGSVRANRVK